LVVRAPRKPALIIDREAEWRELADLYSSDRPELIFVLGRRRAGKSFVLSKFTNSVKGLYYQSSKRLPAVNGRGAASPVA
jgi:AAA+ ATPase superfamily predicted ATPase